MSAYAPTDWTDFGVAVVGAAAALSGLLFVAVSINIERILALRGVPARAAGALIMFGTPLTIGTLLLVPEQPDAVLAAELLVSGVIAGGALLRVNRPANRNSEEPYASWLFLRFVPAFAVGGFLWLAGLGMLTHAGGGLYWLAPVVPVAFLSGLSTTWALLIEILR